ncbi:TPA: hypothetical protein RY299_005092 [Enterobacter cloacae]|uniref:hypothetical protein n=1 Tax=Enterobacteriaceae TaxID=543 RepID=UPI0008DA7D31|nr:MULTISPECIES: hypothetical protein [Enterobacteriaceae]HEB0929399.1 hypothetical protein [Enterobacter cloacae]HEB0944336.1 hypothetical protein [Enterobacter cloacae]HEB0954390.1 hypothetical protein [Enterobacter cloacae]HEB0959424.1 hypothetical protein [Enterobacter cloacae]
MKVYLNNKEVPRNKILLIVDALTNEDGKKYKDRYLVKLIKNGTFKILDLNKKGIEDLVNSLERDYFYFEIMAESQILEELFDE